jgi:hypothetical protein
VIIPFDEIYYSASEKICKNSKYRIISFGAAQQPLQRPIDLTLDDPV